MSKVSLSLNPDGTLRSMHDVYKSFAMPGALGILNFADHSKTIALAGIFDIESIVCAQQTVVQKIRVEHAQPSTDAAKSSQEALIHLTSNEQIAHKHKLMEKLIETAPKHNNSLAPFILGKTIQFKTIQTSIGLRITGLEPVNS